MPEVTVPVGAPPKQEQDMRAIIRREVDAALEQRLTSRLKEWDAEVPERLSLFQEEINRRVAETIKNAGTSLEARVAKAEESLGALAKAAARKADERFGQKVELALERATRAAASDAEEAAAAHARRAAEAAERSDKAVGVVRSFNAKFDLLDTTEQKLLREVAAHKSWVSEVLAKFKTEVLEAVDQVIAERLKRRK